MKAQKIRLENFRNLEPLSLELSDGVNIIYGDNAQGKTNILESIFLFSAGKSFRAVSDKELINFNTAYSKAILDFEASNRNQSIEISLYRDRRKQIKQNGVKLNKVSELIGSFTTVLFAPEHLNLIKDGPSERRRFLDFSISELSPRYFSAVTEYIKLHERRNSLLKKIYDSPSLIDTLDVWDIKLAKAASTVTYMRNKYVERLVPVAVKVLDELSGAAEKLSLEYRYSEDCRIEDEKILYEDFLLKLKENRQLDIKTGLTNTGPHRDDIEISINGYPARKFGSQGQQRSCVLAMKIAEGELLYEEYGEYPMFLLDDVLSELDQKRQEYILSKLYGKQVAVTSCEPFILSDNKNIRIFSVKNGKVT